MKREKIIETANKYKGAAMYSARHKELVKAFNKVKPNGYTAHTTDPWCAIAASAWAILAYGKNTAKEKFPLSASVPDMLKKAKKMMIWHESDKTKPEPGDLILYDWDDSGKGDDKGSPDHVGLVTKTGKNDFTVLEGNKGKGSKCDTRKMKYNGRYIRGFIKPKYNDDSKAEKERIEKLADATMRGEYGNGAARKKKLGSDYDKVQEEINRRKKDELQN